MRAAPLLAVGALLLAPPAVRAEDAPKPEDVTIKTADGMKLAATYHPPRGRPAEGAPSVVALHMFMNRRQSYEPIVPAVTEQGMGLLAIDLRGHGGSKVQDGEDLSKKAAGRDGDLFRAMHHDAAAGIKWLRKTKKVPKGKVALLGASVGCSVAIDTAVRHPDDVACVVALTPGTNYLGVPTMEHIHKWPEGKPLFVLSSEGEKKKGAGPILEALREKGCEIHTVPGGQELHGTRMFRKVTGIEEKVAAWIVGKTDRVDPDGRIQPYEKHARTRVEIGKWGEAFIGPSRGKLYVALQAIDSSPWAPRDRLELRIPGDGEDRVVWLHRPASGFKGGAGKRPFGSAETLLSDERLKVNPGEWFHVVVVVVKDGNETASEPVRVKLP
jgi:pimeloyl-ACP methyl ester carboxylesterase